MGGYRLFAGKLNWPTSAKLVTSGATSGCLTFGRAPRQELNARHASKQAESRRTANYLAIMRVKGSMY